MANPWVQHIKDFAMKKKVSYACALGDPKCKASYYAGKAKMTMPKKGTKKAAAMEMM